jgi:transcriptional regulator GlxA family with amidase domain
MDTRMKYLSLLHPVSYGLDDLPADRRAAARALENWVLFRRYWYNDVSVATLASETGVPARVFSSLCPELLGERFLTVRKHLRISDAAVLLFEHSDLTMTQVALMVGFNDKSDFRKAFREETGLSPRFWQESKGNKLRLWMIRTLAADGSRCL